MSIVGKITEVKNIAFKLYEIFSDKAESKRRDAEFNERVKHDEHFQKSPDNILKFQKVDFDENRDITAI